MGKILAIDYGTRRIGLAVTDDLQIIASALTTVESDSIYSYLDQYFKENSVLTIVVGDPGPDTHNTEPSNEFTAEIQKRYPNIEVVRHDERYTSVMAKQTMLESGISKKKRRDKSIVDRISATLILQSYLNEIQR